MVKKIYRKLTKEQRQRGVIFSSTLSPFKFETETTTTHEVFKDEDNGEQKINHLKDDRFFNSSTFKFNIIRTA